MPLSIFGFLSRLRALLLSLLPGEKVVEYPDILRDPAYGVHRFAKLPGVVLHYVENGSREQELLLFLHGFPEFWFSWRHQLRHFSRDHWTVAVDMRGFGESEKKVNVSDYKIDVLVDDVKNLLQYLGRSKCTVVAHDWGGVVAHHFIRLHPKMVNRYILLNTVFSVKLNEIIYKNGEQFRKSWYIFLMKIPRLPEYLLKARNFEVFDRLFGQFSTADEINAYKFAFLKFEQRNASVNYYRANFDWRATESEAPSADELNALHVPGLYIHGSNDSWLSMDVAVAGSFEDVANVEVIVVRNANHFVQIHRPERVNRIMRRFLERRPSMPSKFI